ncbi:hypothetical protein PR202_ga24149 [Eleusine coracana subsp. coracana]|uniref:Uncharacterized protein n=1 Tax=Eleusine coracana subsp. coracana TaxID=191504 RepID=A0AAV5D824_ELECO|nr:hypothetical protein PR202_ga24149 [Eleusine coracana subsp. coracana]
MASRCSSKALEVAAAAGDEMLMASELGLSKAAGVGDEDAVKECPTKSRPEVGTPIEDKLLPSERRAKRKSEEMVVGCFKGDAADAVAAAGGDEYLTSGDSTPDEEDEDYDEELNNLYEGWMRKIQALSANWNFIEDEDDGEEVVQESITN